VPASNARAKPQPAMTKAMPRELERSDDFGLRDE